MCKRNKNTGEETREERETGREKEHARYHVHAVLIILVMLLLYYSREVWEGLKYR